MFEISSSAVKIPYNCVYSLSLATRRLSAPVLFGSSKLMKGLAIQTDLAAFLAVDNNINAYDARRTMKREAAFAKRALDHLVSFAVAALTGLSV